MHHPASPHSQTEAAVAACEPSPEQGQCSASCHFHHYCSCVCGGWSRNGPGSRHQSGRPGWKRCSSLTNLGGWWVRFLELLLRFRSGALWSHLRGWILWVATKLFVVSSVCGFLVDVAEFCLVSYFSWRGQFVGLGWWLRFCVLEW
jgi:hypothetical protein